MVQFLLLSPKTILLLRSLVSLYAVMNFQCHKPQCYLKPDYQCGFLLSSTRSHSCCFQLRPYFSLITFYRIFSVLHMKIMLENTSTVVCEHVYTLKIREKKVNFKMKSYKNEYNWLWSLIVKTVTTVLLWTETLLLLKDRLGLGIDQINLSLERYLEINKVKKCHSYLSHTFPIQRKFLVVT